MKNNFQHLNINALLPLFETAQDLKEVFEVFLDSTPSLISELEEAHTAQNYVKIANYAHKIKSGYRQMLLPDALLVEEIEKTAKANGDMAQIDKYLIELRSGYASIVKEMQQFITEH
jgi:HPt (histidine-containing phosphotransfer) domain-containing protein